MTESASLRPPTGPFHTPSARRAGISRRRIASTTLDRPFVAVRAPHPPTDVLELCSAYAPKMADGAFFSHVTAGVLHEMWLPLQDRTALRLDVSVLKPARAPRDARVRGHHLIDRPGLVWRRRGFAVSNPIETWCQLATVLSEDDLVIAAESLLQHGRPGVRVLHERLAAAARDEARPMSRRLAHAAVRLRPGSRSALESQMRLCIVADGMREPEINGLVSDGDEQWEVDLVFREEKVLIEVEGDHHRTDKKQWRKDVVRYERLMEAGWRVIRVTADDVFLRPRETLDRIRRALAAAGRG